MLWKRYKLIKKNSISQPKLKITSFLLTYVTVQLKSADSSIPVVYESGFSATMELFMEIIVSEMKTTECAGNSLMCFWWAHLLTLKPIDSSG